MAMMNPFSTASWPDRDPEDEGDNFYANRPYLGKRVDALEADETDFDDGYIPAIRPEGPGKCPRCGGETRQLTNKSQGTTFYGCKRYPECTGTRDG